MSLIPCRRWSLEQRRVASSRATLRLSSAGGVTLFMTGGTSVSRRRDEERRDAANAEYVVLWHLWSTNMRQRWPMQAMQAHQKNKYNNERIVVAILWIVQFHRLLLAVLKDSHSYLKHSVHTPPMNARGRVSIYK
jgi:hypothetical protein